MRARRDPSRTGAGLAARLPWQRRVRDAHALTDRGEVDAMGSAIESGRLRWVWIGLLVPPLVLVGTYSDSVLAPLGWITAFIVLCLWAFLMVRNSRRHP